MKSGEAALSVVQNDLRLVFFGECFLRDLVSALDELPQHRFAAYDLGVMKDVGRVWQTIREVGNETDAADRLQRILFL